MGAAVSRLLVAAGAASALAAGGLTASATGAPRGSAPGPCAAHVAVRLTDAATDGALHRMTVVLSSTGNAACTLAGFPDLVLPSAQSAPLAAGHLTLPRDVVLTASSPASFGVRYTTSQAPATAPCSLGVVVNGLAAAADGTLPLAACASITQVDVTSYASGTQPPTVAPPPQLSAHLAACGAHDLAVREVRTAPAGQLAANAIYALQNRGAACRVAGSVGVRLLDSAGTAYSLRFAPRRTMAMLLALATGAEASFTVAYEPPGAARCPRAERIEVYVAADPTPVAGAATVMACTGTLARVSDLRVGLPLAPGTFGVPSA